MSHSAVEPISACVISPPSSSKSTMRRPHPQAVGIDLGVPRGVGRVGEIDSLAFAADLYHLRAAVECLSGFARVSRTAHDPAEINRAPLLRVGRVGDVVLDELPGSPA